MNKDLMGRLHVVSELYQQVIWHRAKHGKAQFLRIVDICSASENYMLSDLPSTNLTSMQLLLSTLVDNGSLAFTSDGMQVVADRMYPLVKRITNDNSEYVQLRKNLERFSKVLEDASPNRDTMHIYQRLAGKILTAIIEWKDVHGESNEYIAVVLGMCKQIYSAEMYKQTEEHLNTLVNCLLIEAL